jgi:hypothetical protein
MPQLLQRKPHCSDRTVFFAFTELIECFAPQAMQKVGLNHTFDSFSARSCHSRCSKFEEWCPLQIPKRAYSKMSSRAGVTSLSLFRAVSQYFSSGNKSPKMFLQAF